MFISLNIEASAGSGQTQYNVNFKYHVCLYSFFLAQFCFSKNGHRYNSSLTCLYCSHKSIQKDLKLPPKEKVIIEFESDKRAERREGME